MSKITNKAFLTYFDSEVMYQMLPDAEAGKLIKAMFRYCKDGAEVLSEKDGMAYGYFAVLKGQFDRDNGKYVQQTIKKRERDNQRYKERKKLMDMLEKEGKVIVADEELCYHEEDDELSCKPF